MKKLTNNEFIKKAREIHGDKYDYSKVDYINNKTKVCIICPEHGEFWQKPNYHLSACGCPKCKCDKIKKTKYITTESFIQKAHEVHESKYDYSKVEYKGIFEKVCIICPEHGEFWQTPNNHLNNKRGCPKCGVKAVWDKRGRITTESFIQKARNIHGDKYDYSKVEYINSQTKVCIICPEHGEFWQAPSKHLSGQGCSKCGVKAVWDKRGRITTESFIQKAHEVHEGKYDYSKSNFTRKDIKLCIICPEHGEFWQTPSKHLNGQGCPKCQGKNRTTKEFIEKSCKTHNNKYNYSKVDYINSDTKVCIICPEHGEFWQTPNNHLNNKRGCPKCAIEYNVYENRLYEELLKVFCEEEIILQYRNKTILGLKSIDIFFPKYSIGIEYQGRQHFMPVTKFGGEKGFKATQIRDKEKLQKCKNHNIDLLYFTYDKKDIPDNYFSEIMYDVEILKEKISLLINIKNGSR